VDARGKKKKDGIKALQNARLALGGTPPRGENHTPKPAVPPTEQGKKEKSLKRDPGRARNLERTGMGKSTPF